MTRLASRYCAVAGAVVAVAALMTLPSAQAEDFRLLPDLRQAPVGCPGGYGGDPSMCANWDVCMVVDAAAPNGECVTTAPIGAVRLRFTVAEDNVGDGPLLLYGHRDSTGQPTMAVRQAFQTTERDSIPNSYEAAQRATATSTYYEPAAMHQHWHLMGFEHFQLRNPYGDTLVVDRKNGFCLGDRYATPDAANLPNTPRENTSPPGELAQYLGGNMCKHHQPSTLDVIEGISVGSGDDYLYTVDFQWLDITRVPSGVYDVINTVNEDHTLVEKDYGNNSSAIAISIQWPGGAGAAPEVITAPPLVRLLHSCPGRARCAVERPPTR
jgi:hypothetical protein